MPLKTDLKKLKPLKICLTAFALSACQGAPKFPVKYIYEVDLEFGVCGQYEIVDFENLKVRHTKDFPLKACSGVFGFATADAPKVLRWGEKTQNYVKEKCK